jgi:tetratricopeptide (TPR) repeat protein
MQAFVVQPIRHHQDPDHEHFQAIYARVRHVLEARGYDCLRADEVEKSGAITKAVVHLLSTADLVVADLTDLNPNVYYELGVRHALRGSGTMLLLDEVRTSEIPFDLSAYRVIRFEGTLPGIGRLEQRLEEALDQGTEYGPESDNPVHDWLPELPANALATADGSEAGELRRQLKEHEDVLARYRDRFGALDAPLRSRDATPLNVVMESVAAAREGNTAAQLGRAAEQAVQARDVSEFLSAIRRVLENEVKVDKTGAMRLAAGAESLGLSEVARSILDYAQAYLDDDDLLQAVLAKSAHSSDPDERARARETLAHRSGLVLRADGEVSVPKALTKTQVFDLGLLLDVLHKDEQYREEFAISFGWVSSVPNNCSPLRDLARSYASLGKRDIALQVFRRALSTPDVDDTTARWLGHEYHNYDETVNALEAFAFAATLDPDESSLFAHCVDELASGLRNRLFGQTGADKRELPEAITTDEFEICARASLSCSSLNQDAIGRIEMASRRLDVLSIEPPNDANRMDLAARHRFATEFYEKLASTATEPISAPPDGAWPDLNTGVNWAELGKLGLIQKSGGE